MLRKKVDIFALLIFSITCIVLGIFTMINGKLILRYNIYLIGAILAFIAIFDFYYLFFGKREKKKLIEAIIKLILDCVFALMMFYKTNLISASITIFFGFYIFLHSFLHLFNFFLYYTNHIKGSLKLFFYFIVTLILSLLLISHPNENIIYAQLIIGLYLIFLGLTKLDDFLVETIPTKTSNKMKARIQIQLPILFAMFIPKRLLSLINEMVEIKKEDTNFKVVKNQHSPDIEVIIHLAKGGTAAFGHVEVCYQNKIYSFGNYDMHSRSFFNAIGDGVICIADRNHYIDYVLEQKNRYLVVFGIQLTKQEKEIVEKRIHNLTEHNTIDYYPDLALADKGLLPPGDYHDMSSEIYKLANGKFKKIIAGKNKKFFVLKTNCVMVANSIFNGIGKNIIALNGIISPGSYYEYLNNAFLNKNSNVITRIVYTKETKDKSL